MTSVLITNCTFIIVDDSIRMDIQPLEVSAGGNLVKWVSAQKGDNVTSCHMASCDITCSLFLLSCSQPIENLRSFRHWHWAGWGTPLDLGNDDHDDMVDLFHSAPQAALRQPKSGNLMVFQIDRSLQLSAAPPATGTITRQDFNEIL